MCSGDKTARVKGIRSKDRVEKRFSFGEYEEIGDGVKERGHGERG